MTTYTSPDIAKLRRSSRADGFFLLQDAGARILAELLEILGCVIHVEEVAVSATAASLVKSDRGLSLHTDHHRADLIVWHCISQSDEGGDSVLVDARQAYARLDLAQRSSLDRISLQEHRVFSGDQRRYPMVTFKDGIPEFYYSYWLADDTLTAEERDGFEAFARSIDSCQHRRIRLAPGDILAIDNKRMLHGRTPIEGNRSRHLRRYWLEAAACTAGA